jgi:hypothetical protein
VRGTHTPERPCPRGSRPVNILMEHLILSIASHNDIRFRLGHSCPAHWRFGTPQPQVPQTKRRRARDGSTIPPHVICPLWPYLGKDSIIFGPTGCIVYKDVKVASGREGTAHIWRKQSIDKSNKMVQRQLTGLRPTISDVMGFYWTNSTRVYVSTLRVSTKIGCSPLWTTGVQV